MLATLFKRRAAAQAIQNLLKARCRSQPVVSRGTAGWSSVRFHRYGRSGRANVVMEIATAAERLAPAGSKLCRSFQRSLGS